jgi:hypothetical protein
LSAKAKEGKENILLQKRKRRKRKDRLCLAIFCSCYAIKKLMLLLIKEMRSFQGRID